jgi:hypothetical protein
MTQLIIDRLEVVEVEAMESKHRIGMPHLNNAFVEASTQQRPIGQARQAVLSCEHRGAVAGASCGKYGSSLPCRRLQKQ